MTRVEVDINRVMRKIEAGKYLPENKKEILRIYNEVKAQDKSLSTQRHYLEKLHLLAEFIPKKKFKDMNAEDIQGYKNYLKDKGYAAATIWLSLVLIRVYMKKIGNAKCMDWFSANTSKLPSRLEGHQILTEKEIMQIVNSARDIKQKTIIYVGWESTARNSELCNLDIGDCIFSENSVKLLLNGKTGQRDAYLISSAPLLREYLEHYHYDNKNGKAPLFYSTARHKNKRMTKSGYRFIVRSAGEEAGITKPLFPHALRYSRALWCALHKINEVAMRKMFGWSRSSPQPSRYAAMASTDLRDILLQEAGIKTGKETEKYPPVICPKCKTANTYGTKTCKECWYVLGFVEAADRDREIKKREAKLLKLLEHPKVLEALNDLELKAETQK